MGIFLCNAKLNSQSTFVDPACVDLEFRNDVSTRDRNHEARVKATAVKLRSTKLVLFCVRRLLL